MAEKRRAKQKRREEDQEKPTKDEYGVAKFLRFNLPTREGKLVGMTVQYFVASKAVDLLMGSKWATQAKTDALFTTRNGCIDYCNRLLQKGMFHRAARIGKKKEKDVFKKKKKIVKEGEQEESGKEGKDVTLHRSSENPKLVDKVKQKGEKKSKKKDKDKKKDEEEDQAEKESEGEKEEKKEPEKEKEKKEEEKKLEEERRRKKKVRLEMHDHQIFKDGDEVYVWIYDPVPLKTFIIGLLLVLGAIAVCMFPLWPPEVRLGVYYLSVAAAVFVGVILSLCVIRLVLFCIIWGVTFGRHHFWFLPNLTEDVGFLDSFRPLYKHDYCDGRDEKAKKDRKKEKAAETKEEKENDGEKVEGDEKEDSEERVSEKEGSEEGSEDNGYEIVERDEVPDDVEEEASGEEGQEEKDEETEESKKTK